MFTCDLLFPFLYHTANTPHSHYSYFRLPPSVYNLNSWQSTRIKRFTRTHAQTHTPQKTLTTVHALKRIQTRDLNPETRLLLSAESILVSLFLFIGFADYTVWPSSNASQKICTYMASWQLTAQ